MTIAFCDPVLRAAEAVAQSAAPRPAIGGQLDPILALDQLCRSASDGGDLSDTDFAASAVLRGLIDAASDLRDALATQQVSAPSPEVVAVMASLAAAISLLERAPKAIAPSDKMFDLMLSDYRRALDNARRFFEGEYTIADDGAEQSATAREIAALVEERNDLRSSVIAFCAPWAVKYAKMHGLPDGTLFPTHYDLLAKCGARMVDFKRAPTYWLPLPDPPA